MDAFFEVPGWIALDSDEITEIQTFPARSYRFEILDDTGKIVREFTSDTFEPFKVEKGWKLKAYCNSEPRADP